MNDVMASSVVVRALRRVAAGSVVCAVAVAALEWGRRMWNRMVGGPVGAWSPEQEHRKAEELDSLAAGSRFVAALTSLATAPMAALPAAASMRLLAPVLRPDLQARVRVVGYVLVIAVLTHTMLLGAFDVPVQVVGWSCRMGVAAAGLFAIWRPRALAAAIRDRRTAA